MNSILTWYSMIVMLWQSQLSLLNYNNKEWLLNWNSNYSNLASIPCYWTIEQFTKALSLIHTECSISVSRTYFKNG